MHTNSSSIVMLNSYTFRTLFYGGRRGTGPKYFFSFFLFLTKITYLINQLFLSFGRSSLTMLMLYSSIFRFRCGHRTYNLFRISLGQSPIIFSVVLFYITYLKKKTFFQFFLFKLIVNDDVIFKHVQGIIHRD